MEDSVNTDIGKLIEEVVPELQQPKLSFWKSLWRVGPKWNKEVKSADSIPVILNALLVVSIIGMIEALFIGFVLDKPIDWVETIKAGLAIGFFYGLGTGLWSMFGDFEGISWSFYLLLIIMAFLGAVFGPLVTSVMLIPLSAWVIQAKNIADSVNNEPTKLRELPSFEIVQERLLKRISDEIRTAKTKVVGPESEIEKRIATLKAKRNEAAGILSHFVHRRQEFHPDLAEHTRFDGLCREASEVRDMFDRDIKTLEGEQKSVLDLFNEVEAFVPAERTRLTDDKVIDDLRRLRGEAVQVRTVSREMIMQSVEPVVARLQALNVARERLLSHSMAALRPISLDAFISSTEAGVESVVHLESTLRKLGGEREGVVS